ncbi:MAG: histidine kinase, partial [Candidatus Electrothrix sp. ATG2]|nr:histidine kinase [Candidatus Electrothrix sp. ATG2]
MHKRQAAVSRGAVLSAVFVLLCSLSATAPHCYAQKKTLQSASELDYPPFALVRPDGTADGFSVELLKSVVEAADFNINISVGPWHDIKQQLKEGRLDVLPLVAYSNEREKYFDFTVSYLKMHGTIFVRKGETSIRSEADLKDKKVLIMLGDAAHEYAISRNLSEKLILTSSFEEAMLLLSSGRCDAVLCQYLMG